MGANLSKALGQSQRLGCQLQSYGTDAWSGTAKMFGNKEMRLLMLGLDAAGKTS